MKNAFYFILKALFVLTIFKFLLWIFDHIEKNDWIRRVRLILKAIVSQPDLQKFSIHILPNISRSKFNQKMKFGHGIEYNQRNIFLQETCRNKSRRLVLDLVCFFSKKLFVVEASGLRLCFSINIYWTWHTMKTNCMKLYTIDPDVC